jgi:rare lipoprotein A (peptidoglycan hydrolase)
MRKEFFMKKILSLVLLPLVAGCGVLNGGNGDFANNSAPMGEESLNGTVADDYAESKITTDAAASEKSLIYAGPKYHIGTPYKIEDVQYTPAEDWKYNQTGIAGIVPVDLNGVATTNGEKFDTDAMIAASKVLPLPSIVKVTNLDNGQTAVVRVNNRGPFVNSRLMDVSPAAAQKLGMTGQTKVQVEILVPESQKVKALTLGGAVAPVAGEEAVTVSSGPYTVQVGAYYSEESANAIATKIAGIGAAKVVQEGGMYKIRITDLSAADAKTAIQRLRDEESMAPGLLKDGMWVNADSI